MRIYTGPNVELQELVLKTFRDRGYTTLYVFADTNTCGFCTKKRQVLFTSNCDEHRIQDPKDKTYNVYGTIVNIVDFLNPSFKDPDLLQTIKLNDKYSAEIDTKNTRDCC